MFIIIFADGEFVLLYEIIHFYTATDMPVYSHHRRESDCENDRLGRFV